MPVVKSFTVGDGDMFYIKHGSDSFTIIDCQLFGEHKEWLVKELQQEAEGKTISRFISTHPDEDHIQGLEYLDQEMPIINFYSVKNDATKPDESGSFKHYCKLRDSSKAYYVEKGCRRKWLNETDNDRTGSGLHFLWPDVTNTHYNAALKEAAEGSKFNNISLVLRYSINQNASFMWIGDLETEFMENIFEHIELLETTIVFAPHHGRKSGKLPNSWLDKLKPKVIVIGEAEERHLQKYTGYNHIRQNEAGDITFISDDKKLHCYVSEKNYGKREWLDDEDRKDRKFYIGTLSL